MHRATRALLSAVVTALGATSVIAGLAQPAQAMNYTSADLTTWTYTDSTRPSTPVTDPGGDAPIGSAHDDTGVRHTSRAYFTYDLTQYRKQVLHQANLYSSERSVEDCTRTAPIEIWRTRPITSSTTWQHPPRALELVAERNLGKGLVLCPGAYLGIDVLPQLAAAIARKERSITFEVRVAAAAEQDPALGRTLRRFGLSVWANHAPTVSGQQLRYPDRPCGTRTKHPTAGGMTTFVAQGTDADPTSYPAVHFFSWPVDHPEQRTEFGSSSGNARTTSNLAGYADGTVLAWTTQARDHDDAGPWGRTCYLTVDNTAPAAAPVVSSRKYAAATYPGSGGPGVAGTFVFDALGDRDVVGFEYESSDTSSRPVVKANHPGGRARISITPARWGPSTLTVRAVDAAGNRGPEREYPYYVRNSAPFADIEVAGVGLPSRITLRSAAAEVTSFGYAVDGGPETRVPVVDGLGSGEIVFTSTGYKNVVERSYAGRKMIGSYTQQVWVTDTPGIASEEFSPSANPIVGEPGSFTFTPRTTGVVAYLYDFGDGDQQRIEAATDGTAVLRWTPQQAGYLTISVSSVTAAGAVSQPAQESFIVIDTHPTVYSDAGTSWPNRDGVGRPVNVTMYSDLPDVTGFVYSFDGGPEKTADGSYTSVEVVPTRAGDSSFTARAVLADGTSSPATTITIHITSGPLVSLKGPYRDSPVLGRAATFTLKPALPGVTGYRYYWGYFPENEQTVPAGEDGSATFTVTPQYASYEVLSVVSVGADGTESDVRRFEFYVDDPKVEYTGSWSEWGPRGGLGVPGRLGFYGAMLDDTVKYLWHVNDGPVQEVVPAEDALVTDVPYTPDRIGANTVHVQRVFSDGEVSPMAEYTFLVGTQPLVESDIYRGGGWNGGVGVTGVFHFSGGMPGIVSYDYVFRDDSTYTEVERGTVAADSTGAADVRFTPGESNPYTITVIGHSADGTATDEESFWFGVS